MNKIKLVWQKIKTFTRDHFYLVFKSSAENHLRIQKIKKELNFQRKNQIKTGQVCGLEFDSYSQLKKYQKKVRIFTYSFSSMFTSLIVVLIVATLFFGVSKSKGATFGWLQRDWSGGADTNATANHTSNQSGWTKFFSKDDNVDISNGEAKIASTSNSVITTTDTDFNAGTKTSVYVSGSGLAGAIYAQKPDGGTCNTNAECATDWCSTNVCVNPLQVGPVSATGTGCQALLDAIKVYKFDVAGTSQWKATNDACVGPQCLGGVFVADNVVDFTLYPARNACKDLGGRLPNVAELQCIYNNKASYIGAFQSTGYWSATEYVAVGYGFAYAQFVNFSNGGTDGAAKAGYKYVRCVLGQ